MRAIDLNNLKVFRGKLVDYRRKSSTANGSVMFNDMLGTTQGTVKDGKYSASKSSLFGEFAEQDKDKFFTGKPQIDGIGYAFLFRSYRPELAKWQTADPLGYPDGFNNFAYVNNGVTNSIDFQGTVTFIIIDACGIFGPYDPKPTASIIAANINVVDTYLLSTEIAPNTKTTGVKTTYLLEGKLGAWYMHTTSVVTYEYVE